MQVIEEIKKIFEEIILSLSRIYQVIVSSEEGIFSKEIEENLDKLKELFQALQKNLSDLLNKKDVQPVDISEIINLCAKAGDISEKIESKLKDIAEKDAKKIESLMRLQEQIKSALSFISKGKKLEFKT
jgi:uncharacterized phage infection (PIP) family protein YhgE